MVLKGGEGGQGREGSCNCPRVEEFPQDIKQTEQFVTTGCNVTEKLGKVSSVRYCFFFLLVW